LHRKPSVDPIHLLTTTLCELAGTVRRMNELLNTINLICRQVGGYSWGAAAAPIPVDRHSGLWAAQAERRFSQVSGVTSEGVT